MTRSLTRWQAMFLGLAVLIGGGLAAVGLFAIGSRQWLWADTFTLRAGFRQISGVETGTRVRILGRDAGEVERIELPDEPSGNVVLHLRIDGRLRHLVRQDASAQIVAEGMVGGKVVEITPGSDAAEPVADNSVIKTAPTTDLTDLLTKVGRTLENIKQGEGSLGKLLKEDEAYQELIKLIKQGRGTMAALKQDAEAIRGMPFVRSYITDNHKELVRPECDKYRRVLTEAELFEPGSAVLTSVGRSALDDIASWLEERKYKGSEVVVVTYADANTEPELARTVTFKQSKAVCDYLTNAHSVHKMGWFSWSRKVTPLGGGVEPPPVPEREKLPLPRTEILVFVPQH